MGSGARVVVVRSGFPFATTIVLVLLCLMYGITYIDRVNVSTASLVFKQDLHLTNAQVGLVFSAFAYPYVFFTTIGGWLTRIIRESEKIRRQKKPPLLQTC